MERKHLCSVTRTIIQEPFIVSSCSDLQLHIETSAKTSDTYVGVNTACVV